MAVQEVDNVMAPLFFLSFEFIMYFVVANMFVAILNHLYRTTLDIHLKFNGKDNKFDPKSRMSNWQLWKNIMFPGLGDWKYMKMVYAGRA